MTKQEHAFEFPQTSCFLCGRKYSESSLPWLCEGSVAPGALPGFVINLLAATWSPSSSVSPWAANSPDVKGNAGGATFSCKVLVPGRAAIHVYETKEANAAEVRVRQGAALAAQKWTRQRSHQPRAWASPSLPLKETPRCCPRAAGWQQKALQRDTQLPGCSAYQKRDREVF